MWGSTQFLGWRCWSWTSISALNLKHFPSGGDGKLGFMGGEATVRAGGSAVGSETKGFPRFRFPSFAWKNTFLILTKSADLNAIRPHPESVHFRHTSGSLAGSVGLAMMASTSTVLSVAQEAGQSSGS